MTKLSTFIVLALALVAGITACNDGARAQMSCGAVPVVAAHRGGNYYTESTIRNFAAAVAHGARVMETDVRFTKTGYGVLLHNATLDVFGQPNINIADISETQAVSYKSSDGSVIEPLHSFTNQMASFPVSVKALIELKVAPSASEWNQLQLLVAPLGKRVWIASAIVAVTEQAKSLGYQTAQIDSSSVTIEQRPPSSVAQLGNSYERDQGRLTAANVKAMNSLGVNVYAWTVNDPTTWAHTVAVGAFPITDDPSGFIAWNAANGCKAPTRLR